MILSAYDAFATQLAAFAAAEGVPVSFKGVNFTPPTSGLWLETSWIPNVPLNYGIGDDGPTQERGLAVVNACGRPGGGINPVLALAERVRAAMGKGTRFAGVRVYAKPAVNVLPDEPSRLVATVTASWSGFDK